MNHSDRTVVIQKIRWKIVRIYDHRFKIYRYHVFHKCRPRDDDPPNLPEWELAGTRCWGCRVRTPKYIREIIEPLRGLQRIADG